MLQVATRIEIQSCSHRTLLYAITYIFMKMFRNSYAKNFGKHPDKLMQRSSNTRLNAPLQIIFWKRSEKRGYSEISKISKTLSKCVLFLLRYRLLDQNSLIQQKQILTKMFPVSFARKQSTTLFIKVTGSLPTILDKRLETNLRN